MGWEEQEELLTEYNKWKAVKEVSSKDVTPAAFMIERAQESAMAKLMGVEAYINSGDFVDVDDDEKRAAITKILEA